MMKQLTLSIIIALLFVISPFVGMGTQSTEIMIDPVPLDPNLQPSSFNHTIDAPQLSLGDSWTTHRYAIEMMYQGYPMYIWDNKTYTCSGINETVVSQGITYQAYNFTLTGDVISDGEGDQNISQIGLPGIDEVHYWFHLEGQVNGYVLLNMDDLARVEVHFTITGVPTVWTGSSVVDSYLGSQALYYTEEVNLEYEPGSDDFGFPAFPSLNWYYSGYMYKYGYVYLTPLMPEPDTGGSDWYPSYRLGNNITMTEEAYDMPMDAHGNLGGESFDCYKITQLNESGYDTWGDSNPPAGGKRETWYCPEIGFMVAEKVENMNMGEAMYTQYSYEYLMSYSYTQPGPEIQWTFVPPNGIKNDNEAEGVIAAVVFDPDGLLNLRSVKVDLGSLNGGLSDLYDDGTHGDAVAYDGNFSLVVKVPSTVTPDKHYSIPLTVTDKSGAMAENSFSVYVEAWNHEPEIITTASSLNPVPNDGETTTVLTIKVNDDDGLEDILRVEADLSGLGGASDQGFTDGGTMGDEVAGDGIYSYVLVVPKSATSGMRSIPVTVVDMKDVSVSDFLSINIESWNDPPRFANPQLSKDTIDNNGIDTVLITVDVTDNEANLDKVRIDLTKVGGGFEDLMYDDGTHGDTTAGDGSYALEVTVGRSISAGTYELVMKATDIEGAYSTSSFLLEVKSSKTPATVDLAQASPAEVSNSGSAAVLFTVRVSDPENRVQSVFIDLFQLGGEPVQIMDDSGSSVSGDQIGYDGTYSFKYTIPKSVQPGEYNLTVKVTSFTTMMGYLTFTVKQASGDGGDGDGGDPSNPSNTDGDGNYVPPTAKDDDEGSKKKSSTPGFHGIDLLLVLIVLAVIILIAKYQRGH